MVILKVKNKFVSIIISLSLSSGRKILYSNQSFEIYLKSYNMILYIHFIMKPLGKILCDF